MNTLGKIDPDDPRPVSQQIADRVRTAIAAGQFGPGDKLPSQGELAQRYGVARETVKAALRMLRAEQLITMRQGSGAFVRTRPDPGDDGGRRIDVADLTVAESLALIEELTAHVRRITEAR